jgi:hypothetical protein
LCHTPIKPDLLGFSGIGVFACGLCDHEVRIKSIGLVAYRSRLPLYLEKIHNVFHVSLLKKAEIDPSQLLLHVPIEMKEDLMLEVKPVKILYRSEKGLRNKKVQLVKILWRNSQFKKEMWKESKIRRKHPILFSATGTSSEI